MNWGTAVYKLCRVGVVPDYLQQVPYFIVRIGVIKAVYARVYQSVQKVVCHYVKHAVCSVVDDYYVPNRIVGKLQILKVTCENLYKPSPIVVIELRRFCI